MLPRGLSPMQSWVCAREPEVKCPCVFTHGQIPVRTFTHGKSGCCKVHTVYCLYLAVGHGLLSVLLHRITGREVFDGGVAVRPAGSTVKPCLRIHPCLVLYAQRWDGERVSPLIFSCWGCSSVDTTSSRSLAGQVQVFGLDLGVALFQRWHDGLSLKLVS